MRTYPIIESINIIVPLTEVLSLNVPVVSSYTSDWNNMTVRIVLTMNRRISVTRVAVAFS